MKSLRLIFGVWVAVAALFSPVLSSGQDQKAGKDDILGFMRGKTANWWLPDDVVFVAEIPHTATGKIQKLALRQEFKDYVLPGTATPH